MNSSGQCLSNIIAKKTGKAKETLLVTVKNIKEAVSQRMIVVDFRGKVEKWRHISGYEI